MFNTLYRYFFWVTLLHALWQNVGPLCSTSTISNPTLYRTFHKPIGLPQQNDFLPTLHPDGSFGAKTKVLGPSSDHDHIGFFVSATLSKKQQIPKLSHQPYQPPDGHERYPTSQQHQQKQYHDERRAHYPESSRYHEERGFRTDQTDVDQTMRRLEPRSLERSQYSNAQQRPPLDESVSFRDRRQATMIIPRPAQHNLPTTSLHTPQESLTKIDEGSPSQFQSQQDRLSPRSRPAPIYHSGTSPYSFHHPFQPAESSSTLQPHYDHRQQYQQQTPMGTWSAAAPVELMGDTTFTPRLNTPGDTVPHGPPGEEREVKEDKNNDDDDLAAHFAKLSAWFNTNDDDDDHQHHHTNQKESHSTENESRRPLSFDSVLDNKLAPSTSINQQESWRFSDDGALQLHTGSSTKKSTSARSSLTTPFSQPIDMMKAPKELVPYTALRYVSDRGADIVETCGLPRINAGNYLHLQTESKTECGICSGTIFFFFCGSFKSVILRYMLIFWSLNDRNMGE